MDPKSARADQYTVRDRSSPIRAIQLSDRFFSGRSLILTTSSLALNRGSRYVGSDAEEHEPPSATQTAQASWQLARDRM